MDEAVLETPRKGGDEDLALRVGSEGRGEATEEDAGVGADGGLWVRLHLGEEAEEIVVEEAIRELQVERDQRSASTQARVF